MNNFTRALRKTSSVLTTRLTRSTIRQCVGASTVSSSSSNDQIGSSLQHRYFASSNGSNESMHVEISKVQGKSNEMTKESVTGMGTDSTSDIDDEEDDMEQEEMFVAPDITLGTDKIEWGGPRRGGRRPEPTRFGDWERKGRCTDF